jgi:ribonuclease G
MSKELVISATPHETRVAILEEGHLCEIYVEREKEFALVGSIYKGRVTRVLPGMQSAFVDIGLDSDAFLYVTDFIENLEEYDAIVTSVEGKLQRMEQQGGQVYTALATSAGPAVEPPEVTGSPAEPTPSSLVSSTAPPLEEVAPRAPEPTSSSAPTHYGSRDTRGYERGGRRGRGGRGRWNDRRGGRDRGPRREFPPSKYAAPSGPEPPLPPGYEPIILPGESLAKYRGRGPVADVPSTPVEAAALPEETAPVGETAPAFELNEAGLLPGETRGGRIPFARARESAATRLEAVPAEQIAPEAAAAAEARAAEAAAPAPAFEAPGPERARFEAEIVAPAGHEEIGGAPQAETPPFGAPSAAPHEPELTPEEAGTIAAHFAEAVSEEMEAEEEEAEAAEFEEAGAEEAFAEEPAGNLAESEALAESATGAAMHEEPEAGAEENGAMAESAGAMAEGAGESPAEESARAEGAPAEERPQYVARVQDSSRARFQRPMRRGGRRGRGGPPRGRMHARHQQQRPPQLITELLKPGQEVIVQIAKEPMGKKGARITSHVALPGRFLVYMPTVDHIGVSRKISSAEERSRLRRLLLEMKGIYPGGFIVRTAASGASDDDIRSDVEFLGRTWSEIKGRSEQRKAPAILHRDLNLVERILRDHLTGDYTSIWIDNEEEYAKVVDFVGRFQPRLVNRVKLFTKETPIFEEFGIQQEIDKSLRPKVWLKSGGYIVINHTEALVAIDVNTGKFVGKGSTRLEDTIVKTNLEAVKEIVRQIRLRDLGGIIVIDFIDMEERRNREKVMLALDDALRSDRAPSKALGFNEFGLVAITRKRTKQALERVLCQPCPYCTGSGMVKSIPTICYEIQSEARKMAPEIDSQSLTLRVHPEIGKALKTRESALVEELEHWTKKSVIIQADPTLHWEQYDIY